MRLILEILEEMGINTPVMRVLNDSPKLEKICFLENEVLKNPYAKNVFFCWSNLAWSSMRDHFIRFDYVSYTIL